MPSPGAPPRHRSPPSLAPPTARALNLRGRAWRPHAGGTGRHRDAIARRDVRTRRPMTVSAIDGHHADIPMAPASDVRALLPYVGTESAHDEVVTEVRANAVVRGTGP